MAGLLSDAVRYWGDKAQTIAGLLQAGAEQGAGMVAPTRRDLQVRSKIGELLADFAPVVGGVKGTIEEAHAGNPGWAAFNAATVPLDVATLGGASAIKGGLLKAIPALAAHTVWHGSPHKFDKFDMSKIGTGEGAQAYGHGLYVAESSAVARDYAEKLAQNAKLQTADGTVVNFGPPPQRSLTYASQNRGSSKYDIEPWQEHLAMNDGNMRKATTAAKKQLQEAQDSAVRLQAIGINDPNTASLVQHWEAVLDGLKTKGKGAKYDPGQYMYKVDIPDEAVARFLDWDKPLSQQAPEVQRALEKYGINKNSAGYDAYQAISENQFFKLAEDDAAYNAFGRSLPRATSEALRQSGIPGIRYLDGGSRGAGNGTSNFVLFSDDLARILERNGQATGQVPWKPGEWRGLLGGQ